MPSWKVSDQVNIIQNLLNLNSFKNMEALYFEYLLQKILELCKFESMFNLPIFKHLQKCFSCITFAEIFADWIPHIFVQTRFVCFANKYKKQENDLDF